MPMHIRPKHQKLILQCYPPGRGADKRPNPSELSYLLYYASTRRSKLTKVGAFLESKTSTDVYKGRSGDIQVTLEIIKELIEKTHEDLNLFAANVITILLTVISSNDLALCQHASDVTSLFCQYHDGALFSGDPGYVDNFHQLVETYVSMANDHQQGPNMLQWKVVGLKALKDFASSVAISTPTGLSHIHKIIPVLLSTLAVDTDGSTLQEIDSQIHSLNHRESRHYTTTPEQPEFTGEPMLFSLSIEGLKQFYDTTSNMVLKAAIVTTLAFIREKSCIESWASSLIITCAKWVPVQTRFTVVSTSIEKLVSLPTDNIGAQFVLASMVSSLLSSSVNMIGLSVIDVQRSILYHQATLLKNVTKDNYQTGEPSMADLIDKLRQCVVDLASHIYYATQIPDMLSELLLRFQDAVPQTNSTVATGTNTPNEALSEVSSPVTNSDFHSLSISNLLKAVTTILDMTSSHATHAIDISLTISSWDGTQKLLTHVDPDVRVTFANTLIVLLINNSIDVDQVAPLNSSTGFSPTSGPVGRILGELHSLSNIREFPLVSDYLIIYHISTLLVTKLSVNGSIRSAALAYSLQEKAQELFANHEDNISQSPAATLSHAIALATLSLAIYHTIGSNLECEVLSSFTQQEINRRKSAGLWYDPIEIPLTSEFLTDVKTKSDLPQKTPYLLPSVTEIVKDLQYPNQDDILGAFDNFEDVPAAAKAVVVQKLPPTEEISAFASIAASRSSSFENPSGEFNSKSLRFSTRARSLKQLNHNSMRMASSVYVHPTVPEMSQLNMSYINGNSPKNFTPEKKQFDPYSQQPVSNGTEISLNYRSTDTPTLTENGTNVTSNGVEGGISNENMSKPSTDSADKNNALPEISISGSNTNDNYEYINSNQTNGSQLTVPNVQKKMRTVQSFIDVSRENTPRIKDLRKAASGYKLPYSMSSRSINGLNRLYDNSGASGTNGNVPDHRANGAPGLLGDANGGISKSSQNRDYAQSISSGYTGGSGRDSSFSDSDSVNEPNTTYSYTPKPLVVPDDSFDVSSFLDNLSVNPVQERGKLV